MFVVRQKGTPVENREIDINQNTQNSESHSVNIIKDGENENVLRKQSGDNESVHSIHSMHSIHSHQSHHSSREHSNAPGHQPFRRPRIHDRRRQNPPRLQNKMNVSHRNRQGIQNRNNVHSAVHDSHHFLEQIGHAKNLSRYGLRMGAELDPDSNVYVANLPCNYGEEQLRKLFNHYGQIIRLKFVTPDEASQPGYGFVQFQHKNDAHRAMQALEGYTFESGELIYLSIALRRRSSLSDEPTNLYIKQLPPNWDQNMLHQVFGRYGLIRQSKVVGDGIAFVRYDGHEQALNAISNLNKSDQGNGHILEVKFATRKTAANAYRLQQIPAQNKTNSNNLYVRNLPKTNFGQSSLENLFITFGKISSAKSNDNGSAFVRFANANDAQRAIDVLNGTKPDHRFHEELMVKLAHFDIGDSRNRWKNDSNNYNSNHGSGSGSGSNNNNSSSSNVSSGNHHSSYNIFNNNMYKNHFNAPTMSANLNVYGNGYQNNEMNIQSNIRPNTNQLLADLSAGQNNFQQLQQQFGQWQIAGNNNRNLQSQYSQLIPGQSVAQSQQNLYMLSLQNSIQIPGLQYTLHNNMNIPQLYNNQQQQTVSKPMFTDKQQKIANVLFQKISMKPQYSNYAIKITSIILRMGDKTAQMCIDNENELKKQIENAITMLKEDNRSNIVVPSVITPLRNLNNNDVSSPISPLNVNIHTFNNLQAGGTPVDLTNNTFLNTNGIPSIPNRVMTHISNAGTILSGNMANNTAAVMANYNLLNGTLCISPLGTPKGGLSNVSNPMLMPVLRSSSPIIGMRSLNSSPMAPATNNNVINGGWMAANAGLMMNNSYNNTGFNMNINTMSNLNAIANIGNANRNQILTSNANTNANQMKQIYVQPNVQYLGSQNVSNK